MRSFITSFSASVASSVEMLEKEGDGAQVKQLDTRGFDVVFEDAPEFVPSQHFFRYSGTPRGQRLRFRRLRPLLDAALNGDLLANARHAMADVA